MRRHGLSFVVLCQCCFVIGGNDDATVSMIQGYIGTFDSCSGLFRFPRLVLSDIKRTCDLWKMAEAKLLQRSVRNSLGGKEPRS